MAKHHRITIFIILVLIVSLSCDRPGEDKAESKAVGELAVDDESYEDVPRMLDIGSTTCIPCKKMAPILDSLEIVYEGKAEILFIDVANNKSIMRRYGVTMIPTQIFFDKEGNEVYRHIGFFSADSISAQFKSLGVTL